MRHTLALILAWTLVAPASRAQVQQDAHGEPTSIEVLRALRRSYADAEVHERVTIAVRDGRRTQFDEFIIRLRSGGGVREMRLELPTVVIWARTEGDTGALAAAHADNNRFVYSASLDKPLSRAALRGHLPPIIAPQMALALGEAIEMGVADEDFTRGPLGVSSRSVIAAGSNGLMTVLVDNATNRMREYRVESQDGAIWMRIESVTPIEEDAWRIESEGKRTVRALSDLRALPRLVRIGSEFPIAVLHDAMMSSWRLEMALADPTSPPQRPEERYLVLVMHRLPMALADRTRVLEQVSSAIDAGIAVERAIASASRADGLGPRRAFVRVIVRPVACLSVQEARREQISELAERWPLDIGGSGLLWTVPEQALDQFSPNAECAIVIVDQQMRLVRVIRSDQDRAQLESEIQESIMREVQLLGGP